MRVRCLGDSRGRVIPSKLTSANANCETSRMWVLLLFTCPKAATEQTWFESVQSCRLYRNMSRTIRLYIIVVPSTRLPPLPHPHRLEASWDDSSFICEPKWWTRLCVKLPVWVKTGLRLLLIDCGFILVHNGCRAGARNISVLTLLRQRPKWGV